MSRYLVTGSAGFIGSRVAASLLEEGHEVVGLDNLNDSYDVRLKQWRLSKLEVLPHFSFRRTDLLDRVSLTKVFEAPSAGTPPFAAVLNLAARAGVRQSLEDPEAYFDTNVTGTLRLLELCRATGVPKFVLASSSSVYGSRNTVPYREDAHTNRPISPYAASKKAAEVLCHSYHHLYGLDVTVFRYFTVYGPAGRPDMSPFRFIQWIAEGHPVDLYGDGRQSRDFTYIDDVARGTVAGLAPLGYEVINLGSDRPVVLLDFIREVERAVGRNAVVKKLPAHVTDVRETWASIDKAKQLLGWSPTWSVSAGVASAAKWYQSNRDWARNIRTSAP